MIKSLSLILAIVFIAPSKANCQIEGQQKNSPSRNASVKVSKESWDKIIDRVLELVDHDNQEALNLLVQCEQMATNARDSACMITSQRMKAQVLYRLGRTKEAILVFQRAFPFARRHGQLQEQLALLISHGLTWSSMSQYDKSLQNYFDAFEVAVALGDTAALGTIQNNIGFVYYKLKDYPKALYYWKKGSLSQRSEGELSYIRGVNISLAYANMKDFANAWKTLSENIQLCGDSCADRVVLHIRYAAGTIQLGLEHFDKAEQEFLASYELSKRVRNIRMVLDNIYNLSDLRRKDNDIEKALTYLREAEGIIQTGVPFNREIIEIHRRFSELYMDSKNYKKAATYQVKYIALKDSIYSEGLTTGLMKTEADHLEKVNTAKITLQNEVIELKEEMLRRQKSLNIVTGCLAVTVIAFSSILYRNYCRKRHLNVLLDRKIRERTFELESSHHELLSAVNEREFTIRRTRLQIVGTVNTIRGLCYTASKEAKDCAIDGYLKSIDNTSRRLAEIIEGADGD